MFNLSKKKKWTFIVFRDNRRPAIRFTLNRIILLLIPLAALSLTLFSVMLTQAYHKKAREQQHTLTQMEEKETVIESLQKDLIRLSIQTEEMQGQIETLKALEEEINRMTSSSEPEDRLSHRKASADRRDTVKLASLPEHSEQSPPTGDPTDLDEHLGGGIYDVSVESMSTLTDRTKNQLDQLQSQIPSLTERLKKARSNIETYQEIMRATPSIWPTDSKRITSRFGYRQDPFTKRRSYHSGIDIGAPHNDPVYATADGKVIAAGYNPSMGHYVTIDHPASGMQTRYLHLSEILVEKGDHVHKGEHIALVGSTGRSTGPHLHYEIIQNDTLIDPRPFMGSEKKKSSGGP